MKINLAKAYETYKTFTLATEVVKFHEQYKTKYPDTYALNVERYNKAYNEYKQSIEPVETVIAEVQQRVRERKISAIDIMERIKLIEEKLNIPKKHMKGVTVEVIEEAQVFPRAYKYIPEGTSYTITHNGKNWILTDVSRQPCNRAKKVHMTLPDEAKEAILTSLTAW
jgi:hypothetical protein